MGMHSDMRPTHQEQKVASLGDVIGVSAGSDMNFWFGTSVGAKVAKERHAVLLRDGDTWVWKHKDDLNMFHTNPSYFCLPWSCTATDSRAVRLYFTTRRRPKHRF